MSEYIISSEQLERLIEGIEHDIGREITKVVCDGIELPGIVRCRDCTGMVETWDGYECERFSGEYHRAEPDGFCSWAERRQL